MEFPCNQSWVYVQRLSPKLLVCRLVDCVSIPSKHLQIQLFEYFKSCLAYILICQLAVFFSLPLLLRIATLFCPSPPDTVNQWNSVKPAPGICNALLMC